VTDGIISSKSRPNRADGFGEYLQTNAAINPGNSGGPLVNLRGEIIGINTAIISRSGGSQGIGFAIPSNSVKIALESLLKNGRIIRGYLGIQARPTTPDAPETDGVIIDGVFPNSPASDAKLKRDDVIKKFNGHTVRNLTELRSLVSQVELNKKVDIELIRNGSTMTTSAEIKEQPADYLTSRNNREPQTPQQQNDQQQDQPDEANPLSSVEVADVTADVVKRLDLPNRIRGVLVTKVDGEVGELRAGDVIEEVNQQPVTSVSEYKRVVASLDPNGTQVLSVCRHRTRSFVVLRPQ
jgi:serine protease Do